MLKAGVLGAGHLGKIHLKLLKQSEKYNLVGFYDADEAYGKKLKLNLDINFLILLMNLSML